MGWFQHLPGAVQAILASTCILLGAALVIACSVMYAALRNDEER